MAELGPTLPLAVPLPAYVGQPDPLYPLPFVGHRKIEGLSGERLRPDPRNWPAIACQLGRFLTCLHNFPLEKARAYGFAVEPPAQMGSLLEQVAGYSDLLRRQIGDAMTLDIEAYLAGRVDLPPAGPARLALCHADFKGEHILISGDGLSIAGVIDWSDICLSEPLADFVGLMLWLGEAFVKQVLAHYPDPTDIHFLDRVCFVARCRTLINLGERLAGESAAPLDLLVTQMGWAFK